MADEHEKDDEHYAPESGERDESQESADETPDPEHDQDHEHYAPES